MMSKFSLRILLLALCVMLVAPLVVTAQDGDSLPLTETVSLTTGGLVLSIDYPSEWVGNADTTNNILYVASSAQSLENTQTGVIEFDDDEVGISLLPPATIERVGVTPGGSAEEALSAFLEIFSPGVDVEVTPFSDLGVPAAYATVIIDDPATDVLLIAYEFEDGIAMVSVQPSSVQNVSDTVQATVQAMLASVRLSSPNAEPEETVLEVSQPNGTFDFAITVPSGWVTRYNENGGTFYLANTDNALSVAASSGSGISYEEGDIAITIGLPAVVEQLGLDFDADPVDVVNNFIERTSAEGEVTVDESTGIRIAYASISTEQIPGGTAELFALAFDAGTMLVAVQPAGAIDASLLAVLDSIRFGDQSASANAETTGSGEEIRQWASSADGSSEYSNPSYGFEQATDKPNTTTCGDNTTAWASLGSETREFLRVQFDTPVIPSEVHIHQTYNPGSIVMVDVGNSDNPDRVLAIEDSADDPSKTECPRIFTVDLSDVDVPIDFVVIYVDQSIMGNWNEIDAVELVGTPAE